MSQNICWDQSQLGLSHEDLTLSTYVRDTLVHYTSVDDTVSVSLKCSNINDTSVRDTLNSHWFTAGFSILVQLPSYHRWWNRGGAMAVFTVTP